ncbi:hypothetical protein D046_0670B, partial [Vibrio parahaemolyticus V-223/04]
TD